MPILCSIFRPDHGGIAARKSFNLDIHRDNPNNKWQLTKSESVLNPNQCLALITIEAIVLYRRHKVSKPILRPGVNFFRGRSGSVPSGSPYPTYVGFDFAWRISYLSLFSLSGKKLKCEKKSGEKNLKARKKSRKKTYRREKIERGKIEHKICMALTGLRKKTVKATAWPSFLLDQLERAQKSHVTGPDKRWTQNARILQRRPYKRPCGRAFLWKRKERNLRFGVLRGYGGEGGGKLLATTFDLADFRLSMIAPVIREL